MTPPLGRWLHGGATLPAAGNDGDVLTKQPDGSLAWEPPPAPPTSADARYPLVTEVPTLEELQFAITTTTSGVSTAGNLVLASAMFPMKIAAFSIINSSANPGSAANFWTFTLERLRNVAGVATAATIAQKTTYKAGGGEDMIANADWNFDAVAFDAANQLLQKGDVLRIGWAPTGAPTALQVRCYTVRYEPI